MAMFQRGSVGREICCAGDLKHRSNGAASVEQEGVTLLFHKATESSRERGSMARRRYQKGQVYLCGQVWYGRYRDDVVGPGGKVARVRRNIPLGPKREFPTKRLAERRMEQVLHRINAPEYRPGRVATVAEFAERWKVEILSKRKPSTREAAESHLNHHIIPHLGKLRLDNLGVENQQVFVTRIAETVSSKTAVNIIGTLSSMLNTAKNWGYICEGVSFSKLVLPERGVKRESRCFSAEEAGKIIAAAQDPWRLMFAIAAYTGLRAGEVLGLRVEDIDIGHRLLRVTQTAWYGQIQTAKTKGSENAIPIPDVLCEMLKPHLSKQGLLFVNRRGRAYTAEKVVQKRLWPILDALNIPRAGFHAFRHMHTSLLLESGASPKVAQRQLRHSDARITLEVYGHLVEDSHRQAVERVASILDRSGPNLRPATQAIQ
jgi:integrase